MNPIIAISVKIVACIIIGLLVALIRFVVGCIEEDDLMFTKILGWVATPTIFGIAIFWLLRSVIFASLA